MKKRLVIFILVGVVAIGILAYFSVPKILTRMRCVPWHEFILAGIRPERDYLFVAMGPCDSVLAIDMLTHEVAAAVKIDGKYPHGIAVTLDRKYLYVANEQSDDVTVISVADLRVLTTIPVGEFPTDVVPSMDGKEIYVANFKGDTIQVIDIATNQIEQTIENKKATHFAVAPDGQWLFLTQWDEDQLTVLNGQGREVIKQIPMAGKPNHATVSQDGRRVYITLYGADAIAVVDTQRLEVIAILPVGRHPMAPAESPAGRWVYVSNIDSGSLSVIDTERLKVVGEIAVGGTPQHLSMGRDGRLLYVTNPARDSIQVINLLQRRVVQEIYTGPQPQQLAPRYFSRSGPEKAAQ